MPVEKTLSSLRIYEGHTVNLRVDDIQAENGRESIREVVEHREVICVVAIDPEGNILLVRQYRYPVEKVLLEIPAGGIDGEETPAEAVVREMQEETGYLPKKVVRLGGFYSAPGFCSEYLHLFLAENLIPSQLYAEDTDEIELVRIRPDEIVPLITSGEICDSKSIAGLYSYLDHLKK